MHKLVLNGMSNLIAKNNWPITELLKLSNNFDKCALKVDNAASYLGNRDSTYENFLHDLMASGPEDCRYGLFDFEYEHQCQGTSERTKKEKLLLMSW